MNGQLGRVLKEAGDLPTPLAELLDDVETFLARFVVYPSEFARIAHVLWIFHTHCMGEWDSTPRIAFVSPEPESGKSRALEVSEPLVPRPIESVNATPAYLFRKVSDPDGLPTILYDEIDTVFGPRAKDNEEVRGFLNAGHRRGAMAGRCVTSGKTVTTEELPAYCAVAMAGIGKIPDTISTRAVMIKMRRRAPTELVEPYRRRIHAKECDNLRDKIEQWAEGFRLNEMYPEMPNGVEDRAADVWEPLIAISDSAGKAWSKRGRDAAVALVTDSRESSPSLGVLLLTDLRTIFGTESELSTKIILQKLCDLEEAPWGNLRGKELDPRRLASYLRSYGVKSKTLRIDKETTAKGYRAEDLSDAWERYLPSDKSVTTGTNGTNGACSATERRDVTDVTDVTDIREPEKGNVEVRL